MFVRSALFTLLLAAIVHCAYIGRLPESQALTWNLDCRWYGTAPICMGECPWRTNQVFKASSSRYLGLGKFRYTDNSFGQECMTGNKVLCCKD